MPFVHYFIQRQAVAIDIGGIAYQFKPNEQGDVVCDVPEGSALKRMLSLPEGYRLYDVDPALNAGIVTQPVPPAPHVDYHAFVLENDDGSTLDLRTLNDEQLLAFAKDNGINVSPKAKGDTIRNKIVVGLASGEPDATETTETTDGTGEQQ